MVDAETGEVLFEKKGNERALIASMSKIMLAYKLIRAVETGSNSWTWNSVYTTGQEVTFPSLGGTTLNANSTIKGYHNKIAQYMVPGDGLTMESLLYGMMVVSGNDAAASIATALSGSETACLEELNEQMHSEPLSLSDKTHFARVYGRECYSTALDVAKMLKVVLDDQMVAPKFWQVAGCRNTDGKVGIITPNGETDSIARPNTHPFISGKYRERLESMLGGPFEICGKTGTWITDYVLSSAVSYQGRTLISVVLHADSPQKRDDATMALLTWGFNGQSPNLK